MGEISFSLHFSGMYIIMFCLPSKFCSKSKALMYLGFLSSGCHHNVQVRTYYEDMVRNTNDGSITIL
jgi:hypothetical protein